MCGGTTLSPWGPVESPALAPPGCPREQSLHGLGKTHQDESMGEVLPGSFDRWGATVCRHKTLYRG